MITLPIEFEARMRTMPGFDFEKYKYEIENEYPVRALRVNERKLSCSDFETRVDFPVQKMEFADSSYYFECEHVGRTPLHHAGAFYVQEPSAMCPVEAVNIRPDWKVLDACASPGGKSAQIAGKLKEKGILVANEIVPSRCKNLVGNLERMGVMNAIVTNTDSKTLGKWYKNIFDMVLVDAPCSGEGMFRKSDGAVLDWSEENVLMCAERQTEILENLAGAVKNGGYLLYSTCTFSLEENEMNVDRFLRVHPEFTLQKLPDRIVSHTSPGIKFNGCATENIHLTRRFYPYVSKGEGQFMALMKKEDGVNGVFSAGMNIGFNISDEGTVKQCGLKRNIKYKDGCKQLTAEEMKTASAFLKETLESYSGLFVGETEFEHYKLKKYNNNIVIVSDAFPVPEHKVFACGVKVGEIVKGRMVPHHQFFMTYGRCFKRKINLSADKAADYIKGLGIECSGCDNGWAAVLVHNCTLGGAKVVGGYAKNHYPKGLRQS